MKKYLMLLTLLVLLILTACGGGDEEEAAAPADTSSQQKKETIQVLMNDIYFGNTNDNATNPPVWTVTSGAEVTVAMENAGALEHNWAVLKLGEDLTEMYDEATHKDLILFEATKVPAKSNKSVTFTAPEAGEYVVICIIPGHSMLMRGKLIVN